MRIESTLAVVGTLFFAAGCADTQRQAYYGTEPVHGGQVMSSSTYPTYSTATAPVNPPYSVQGGDFDRDLADRVRRELNRYSDLATVTPNLQITAQNGAISLAGSVPTESQRQMIHSIARNTSGVLAVNDQLQVAAPPPAVSSSTYGQSDQSLANQVQENLYSHPVAAGFAQNIRIMVQGGRVTLTGSVPNEQDRHVVDEVVRNTPGVIGVLDQMQVTVMPTGRIQEPTRVYAPNGDNFSLHVQGLNDADRVLAQRILEGMQTGTAVGGSWPGVTINVADGRVILQGTVHSYEEKRAIFDAVQRAAGSNSVYNELHVVP